jgi:DNA-binding MarR family transcriptional regulator
MSEPSATTDHRNTFTVLIKTVHQALRAELDATLRDAGLTLPQLAVLVTLAKSPGASNAELARGAFVSPQSMGELLAPLKKLGFIEQGAHPKNARILQARLTPAGNKALKRGGAEVARVEALIEGAFTASEHQKLKAGLERCAAALTGSRG